MKYRFSFVAVALFFCGLPDAGAQILDEKGLKINLYLSFEMELQVEDQGNGDPNGSFDNDQMDLVINYEKEGFRIATDILFEHGTATEDDRGNVALSFAFAEYAFSPKLKLRAGKYLTPYGGHNQLNSIKANFLSVKLPLATNKPGDLTSQGFRFFPRRQVGLALQGSSPMHSGSVEYDVVLGNGEQEDTNPFEEDNNSEKAINGRLLFRPSLAVATGVSAYVDSGTAADGDRSLTSFGAHFQYEGERLHLWAEVDQGTLGFDDPTQDVDQLGGFAELGVRIGNWTPFAQLQYLSSESDALEESATMYVLGLYYRFKTWAALKLENAYHKGSSRNLEFIDLPGRDYNELRAAIVLGF